MHNYRSFKELESFKDCPSHLKLVVSMLVNQLALFLYYFLWQQFILLELAITIGSYYHKRLYSSDFLGEQLFLPLFSNIPLKCFPDECKEAQTILHQLYA